MLKIRLRRMGSRHRPYYRLVVSDSRRAPTASALDEIGHYDPRDKTGGLKIDLERAESWLAKGARASETVGQLIDRARAGATAAPAAAEAAEAETPPAKAAKAAPVEAETPPAEAPPAAEAETESQAAEA